MAERSSHFVEAKTKVRLSSSGLRFINGISSSYDDKFPEELTGIMTPSELTDIISRLNDTILSFWPCNACYLFGFACSPFTLGASLLCPNYCVQQSDEHANRMLENVSLKAKYYERKIVFRIVKHCCDSHVEISFPAKLLQPQHRRLELAEEGRDSETDGLISRSETPFLATAAVSSFDAVSSAVVMTQVGGPCMGPSSSSRLKDS